MRGSLMRLCTLEQHMQIQQDFQSNSEAALAYTNVMGREVTPQNVAYWRRWIANDGNLAKTDRQLQVGRVLITPQPDDDLGNYDFIPHEAKSILVIGDIHAPYQHPDILPFLQAVRDVFVPDLVVQIGDELDYHAMSFHDADPNLDSAGVELEKGRAFLAKLHEEFPQVLVCHSNHGSMTYRKARAFGIPIQMIKRYRDTIFPQHGAPEWSWAYAWRIQTALGPVLFKHQKSGSLLADAAHNQCNLVVGHEHGLFGSEWASSSAHLYYGANTGCLIDRDSYAFAYGKHFPKKPIIGCMVILNGRPTHIPMVLADGGRWIGRL